MSESNQRRDNDFNYSSQDDPDAIDNENAGEDGRDKARNTADDMNRRGMMIDSEVRRQAGTDLHDGGEYDQQGGARYEGRTGSGSDVQEGAREGANQQGDLSMPGRTPMANSREPMDADRNASDNVSYTGNDRPDRYQSSVAGFGMTDEPARRGSGTGETDARYMHETSNTRSATNVGDEGFSDSLTPASGSGSIRVDPQGDFSQADTEETQADHFQAERNAQGDRNLRASTVESQADHFKEERLAHDEGDYHPISQAGAAAGHTTEKRDGGYLGMTNTSSNTNRIVAAVFQDWNDASRAVTKLEDAGFSESMIGIARLDSDKGKIQHTDASGAKKDDGERVAGGVATGAAVGGVAGLLAALASLAIPGVGPIVAGGMLATTFGSAAGAAITGAGVGAGLGAATGGLIGALTSLGLSEDEARAYESGMRSGGTLVTVQAGDRADDALRMLQQMGGETHSRMGGQSGSSSDPNWRFG
jgi:hypothetical protein